VSACACYLIQVKGLFRFSIEIELAARSWGGRSELVKSKVIAIYLAAFVLFTALCSITCFAEPSRPGGYGTVAVTNKEVVAAADFAIKAHQKVIQDKKDTETSKLELVTITQAEQQVVAGMNYRLHLKVKLDGKEKIAEALVWWQAWRKPDPYQLTSWTWK
jgi:hypothetical protein